MPKELNKSFKNDFSIYMWVYWQTIKAIAIGLLFYTIFSYFVNIKIAFLKVGDEVFKSPVSKVELSK